MISNTHIKIIGFLFVLLALANAQVNHDRVRLRDVTAITLHNGKMTTGRRAAPMPQLICIGGSAGCSPDIIPDVVQCKQVGWDGYDATWECTADLDVKYRFGEIAVLCEGYDFPEDEYILRGSCALEYKLEKTSAARDDSYSNSHNYNYNYGSSYYDSESSFGEKLFYIIIIGIILFALYSLCIQRPYGHYNAPPAGNVPPQGYAQPGYVPPYQPYGYGSYGPGYGRTGWLGGLLAGGMLGRAFSRPYYGGYGGYGGYGHRTYHSPRPTSSRSSVGGSRTASGFGGTRRR